MSTPVWQAGHLYLPGDLVRPATQPTQTSTAITNNGFETGDATGWTLGAGMAIDSGDAYAGTYRVECTGTGGSTDLVHDAVAVSPGRSITASCMYQQGSASAGNNVGCVFLRWYTSGMVQIGTDVKGNIVSSGSGGAYNLSTVTAVAPATAAFVAIGGNAIRDNAASSAFDQFTWNYAASTLPPGLIYKAVQTDPATSGANEPAWPVSVGLTVVDGGVTWEAVQTSRVVWEASPILVSGTVEPIWPTVPGEFVSDGTISWECISRSVEDENCPHSKVVVIVASKVFAADDDIMRYCATANPLDWTTPDDAGYLPTGLQQANSNEMAVANQYRGNGAFFNASSFQNWQVDPDPAAMAILDQMDGVGSIWQQAACPVANDLFYLASLGVRSIGIANATENLQAGDVGMPIDSLVREAVKYAIANGINPISTYYPGAGQYWLTIPDFPETLGIAGDVPDAFVGDLSTGAYTSSGGTSPRTFAVSAGTFPPGLTLQTTGAWSGQHYGGGNADPFWDYSWDVTVTDANGDTATIADTCRVTNFSIAGDVPGGTVGDAVAGSYTNTHGVEPISYAVSAGTFPTGISLDSDGDYAGTFTLSGAYEWTITATDAQENIATLVDTALVEDPPPPIEWISYPETSASFVDSPDGYDWTGAGTLVPEIFTTFRCFVCRNDVGDILYNLGAYAALSNDDGQTYPQTTLMTVDTSAYVAVYAGAYWHICDNTKAGRVDGSMVYSEVASAPKLGAIVSTPSGLFGFGNPANAAGFYSADSNGDVWSTGMTIASPSIANPETARGAFGNGQIGFVAYNAAAQPTDPITPRVYSGNLAGSFALVTNPFGSFSTGGIYQRCCMKYIESVELFVVTVFNRIAYGPTIETLVQSGTTLPSFISDFDHDGEKFVFCGEFGYRISTDLETFTTPTGVVHDEVFSLIALNPLP